MTPLEETRALYAELPTLDCKGLCANSCGPIDVTDVERRRLVQLGVRIPVFTHEAARRWAENKRIDDCPALGPMSVHPLMPNVRMAKCTVYEDRPLICRLWGMAESMLCPNGCRPSRVLSDAEAYDFIFRSMEIGGHRSFGDIERVRRVRAQYEEFQDDPELGPLFARFIRGDQSAEAEIQQHLSRRRSDASKSREGIPEAGPQVARSE